MTKKIFMTALIVVFSGMIAGQTYLVQLQGENLEAVRQVMEQKGYDIAGYNRDKMELGIVTTEPKSLEQWQKQFKFSIASIEATRPYNQLIKDNDGFFDSQATLAEMRKIEQQFPKWAKVFDLNELLGIPATEEGRHVYALQLSVNPGVLEDEPKALLIGNHHARELMTHHAVIDGAWDIVQQAQKNDARYINWLENSAIWFVPLVNPDGLDYVFSSDRWWRKNRARNSDGSRGVDLNRNYAFLWGACGSSSTNGNSQVFRGPSPQSEPEVCIMDRLNEKLHSQFIISYHSYGNEVLYPYKCADLAEAQYYYSIRDGLAQKLNFGKRYASSSGEDFEHHYHHYGTISFLLEIGTSFQPSFSTYRNQVWPNVQKVLPYIMTEIHKPHVRINVTDAATGKGLPASISVEEIAFKEGEIRLADEHGSYRWHLLPGSYNFTVKMSGYQSKSFSITSGKGHVEQHIELNRSK